MTFPRHTHDFYTIGVGLRGAGSIWYRGQSHVRRRNDVVIIPPGEVHTGGVRPSSKLLSYFAAYVPASLVESCGVSEGTFVGPLQVRTPVFQDAILSGALLEAARLVGRPIAPGDARPDAAAAAEHALVIAIARAVELCGGKCRARGVPNDSAVVRAAREVIQSCYADSGRTSLAALAHVTGATPFHVSRAFSRAMGLSPHHYLLQVRVERARAMLAEGEQPSIVAAATGFVDQSHLTEHFKRFLGITPGRYQRGLGV